MDQAKRASDTRRRAELAARQALDGPAPLKSPARQQPRQNSAARPPSEQRPGSAQSDFTLGVRVLWGAASLLAVAAAILLALRLAGWSSNRSGPSASISKIDFDRSSAKSRRPERQPRSPDKLFGNREGEAPADLQPNVEDSLHESPRGSRSEPPTMKTARQEPRAPDHGGSETGSRKDARQEPAAEAPPPEGPVVALRPGFPPGSSQGGNDASGPVEPSLDPQPVVAPKPNFAAQPPLARLPEFPSEAERAAYAESLRSVIETGWRGPNSLDAAQRQFRDALGRSGRDPNLYYAYGLVLLKNSRWDDAARHLQTAADCQFAPCLAAWQALIWVQVTRREYDAALGNLVQLARLLQDADDERLSEEARSNTAAWIGRILGFLEGPAPLPGSQRELLAERESEILAALSAAHREAFQRGKSEILDRYEELKIDSRGLREQAKAQQEQRQAERIKDLEEKKDETGARQKVVQSSTQELQADFEKKMKEYDEQLDELEKSYVGLAAQGKALSATIINVQIEIGRLETQREVVLRSSRSRLRTSSPLDQSIASRTRQLTALQAQYNAASQRAAIVKRKATGILAKRRQDIAQYQAATGVFQKQSETLGQWEKRLEKEAEKTGKPPRKSTPLRALDARLRSLSTYVPLDLEAEKQHVLDAYSLE